MTLSPPVASQPACHALHSLVLHVNIGSISRDRFTRQGPFLEYGRCLHSTYLRKEVRMAGPPSNPPHPPPSLRTHLPKPPRKSSRDLSVHLFLGCDVHSRHWSVGADVASSATEIAGSEFPSPTRHPRPACAHLVRALLSRRGSQRLIHGLAPRNGSPALIRLVDVMQTQTPLRILVPGSRQSRRTPFNPRTTQNLYLQPMR